MIEEVFLSLRKFTTGALSSFLLVLVMVGTAAGQPADTARVTPTVQDTVPVVDSTPPAPDTTFAAEHTEKPETIVDTVVMIPRLDFSGTRLFDALTALARGYNLSLYIDSSVTGTITLRLDNVLLNDALAFILKEYGLDWEKTGRIIKVFRRPPPPPKPEPMDIKFANGLLSFDFVDIDLERLIDTLIDITGRNIIIEDKLKTKVSGKLKNLSLEKALSVLLPANGLAYREVENVIHVGRVAGEQGTGRAQNVNLRVSGENGLVSLEAANVALADVIRVMSSECGISVLVQTKLEGTTTAQFTGKTIEDALTFLLMNTAYTFKETSGLFFIGNKDSQDLFDTKLITIDNLIAATVEPIIPAQLTQQLAIKVVKEHNGLLVTGPRTSIARLQNFVKEVDVPAAQVLFEVLVVDYTTTEYAQFGITANNYGGDSGLPHQTYWPNVDVSGTGTDINNALRSIERHAGWSNLGVLDDNFFIRLEMLQQEGKAKIVSRPQIASLNGHSASISIGTTQYYLLESQTIYPSQETSVSTQTSQRFEKIEADISLVVTPYVSRSGSLIVDVEPEFSTPSGQFNPDVPPTINKRLLKSTLRLNNGETVVLGGLVQETKNKTIEKVPILGSIPILGRLFQNRSSDDLRSELMIYITPFVYFGSEGAINIDSLGLHK